MKNASAERRLYTRMPVEFAAILYDDKVNEPCRILDFGQGGARIACPEGIEISETVDLTISGLGNFHGVIAWQEANTLGVTFCPPGQKPGQSAEIGIDPF